MRVPTVVVACALVCVLAAPALAAPRKSAAEMQALVQNLMKNAPEGSRQETLNSLRETLLALQTDIVARLDRVAEMEAAEAAPVIIKLEQVNATIKDLEASIEANRHKLGSIPDQEGQLHLTIATSDATIDAAEEKILSLTNEGERQLNSLQVKLQQAKADTDILVELLKWLNQVASEWDESSLAQIQGVIAKLHHTAELPANLFAQTDATKTQSVHGDVKAFVTELRESVEAVHANLTETYANLTLHLGNEKSRLEGTIASAKNAKDFANTQLAKLSDDRAAANEAIASAEAKLHDAHSKQSSLLSDLSTARSSWASEREQLTAIKTTIHSLLLMLMPVGTK